MKKKKLFNKIIYSVLLMSLFLANSIGTAQALFGSSLSIPSIGEIMDEVETQYGFDKDILRRGQRKITYPQVEVFFDKTAPIEGEKVTATAMPKYFKNTAQELYYTWFLIRESDDLDSDGDFSDEDGLMEKAKQRAMGIVARGDFDPLFYKTNYTNNKGGDEDRDGYEASYGGDNGVGGKTEGSSFSLNQYEFNNYVEPIEKQAVDTSKITRCYRHNFGVSNPDSEEYEDYNIGYSGEDLIVECEHKFPKAPEGETFSDPLGGEDLICEDEYELGDGSFKKQEELCWQLDPDNPDTDGDGFLDEADLVGLGQQQLIWNYEEGDRVGIIVEGTSMIPTNETTEISQTELNPLIFYECSSLTSVSDYCVDSNGNIGSCVSGTCSIGVCADPANDIGEPCATSGGAIGTCSFTGMSGTCEEVISCSNTASSDGDLCQEDGIAGICLDSDCVLSSCGDGGDKCQSDLGNLGVCSETGVCVEESNEPGDLSMNSYYKIAWAGLDVCDRETVDIDEKEDFLEDDECENDDDYGFNYLATKRVSQQADELIAPTLISNVSKIQVIKENLNYSDFINVKAFFDNQTNFDPDFIYYNWSIYLRNKNGEAVVDELETMGWNDIHMTDDDEFYATGENLIDNAWAEGEVTGGLGENSISFRVTNDKFKLMINDLIGINNDAYAPYHFLIVLNTEVSGKSKIASIEIPIVLNQAEIKIADKNGNLICQDDNYYYKICPIYPGQQVYAFYSGENTDIISWELEKEKIPENFNWAFPVPSSSTNYTSFRLITTTGSDMELQTVSLKVKKENGDEITSERLLSIAKPIARISSENSNAIPVPVGEVNSENVFNFNPDTTLSFKANMIPTYLDGNLNGETINLKWYINDQEVNDAFIADNSENQIDINDQEISFKLLETNSDSIKLTLKVTKQYTQEEKDALASIGINISEDLFFKKNIILKKSSSLLSADDQTKRNSISVFMASTLSNAPEYFIFIIKTAIVFVLFWSLLFGFNYWFSWEVKLKELND